MTVSSRKPRSLTLIDPFLEQGLPLVGTPKKREREKGLGGWGVDKDRKKKKRRLNSAARMVAGRGRVLGR